MTGDAFKTSSFQILPFINLDPTKPDSIYSALGFTQDQAVRQYGRSNETPKLLVAVTFDQPLYAKADDIHLANHKELDRLFIRLGGFHLVMSYLGGVGFIMKVSGIEELLSTVYAPKVVDHMMSGHAYARALRRHFPVSAALSKLMLDINPGCLAGIGLPKLKDIHALLLQGNCDSTTLLNTMCFWIILQAIYLHRVVLESSGPTTAHRYTLCGSFCMLSAQGIGIYIYTV